MRNGFVIRWTGSVVHQLIAEGDEIPGIFRGVVRVVYRLYIIAIIKTLDAVRVFITELISAIIANLSEERQPFFDNNVFIRFNRFAQIIECPAVIIGIVICE